MDQTFHKLIRRATERARVVKGSPWEIVPVKNQLYAR